MILKGIYKQLVKQDVIASNLKLYYLIRNEGITLTRQWQTMQVTLLYVAVRFCLKILIIMLHHILEANVCVVMCVQNFAAVTIAKVMSCSLVKVKKQCYSTKLQKVAK